MRNLLWILVFACASATATPITYSITAEFRTLTADLPDGQTIPLLPWMPGDRIEGLLAWDVGDAQALPGSPGTIVTQGDMLQLVLTSRYGLVDVAAGLTTRGAYAGDLFRIWTQPIRLGPWRLGEDFGDYSVGLTCPKQPNGLLPLDLAVCGPDFGGLFGGPIWYSGGSQGGYASSYGLRFTSIERITSTAIPEPATSSLLLVGLLALIIVERRRRSGALR